MFMKGTLLVKALALAAILTTLTLSTPGAEEILHHGDKVDSDGSSNDCLSCHDGVIAKPVMLSVTVGNYFCNHPINRDYPPTSSQDAYQSAEQVTAAGIKLLNGQVSCISCHNLKNTVAPHLAVPIDKSDLCFTCHKI
jgi:predicted CXXCH cytochrome family protein